MKSIAFPMLVFLGKHVPKRKRLVVFGGMNGISYGDNGKYLFEWMIVNRPELDYVWLTQSRIVCIDLEKRGLPVKMSRSVSGLFTILRASTGVFSNSLSDLTAFPALVPDSINLIALRHGQAVKASRFAMIRHGLSEDEERIRRRESGLIKYAISTSDLISDMQEQVLNIGREKHITTGYPRNDSLLNISQYNRDQWEKFLEGNKPDKVILYAPTWRNGRVAPKFFPFKDFMKKELSELLSSANALLLLRPHLADLHVYPELHGFLSELATDHNVRLATHTEFPDTNTLLPFVDLVISDYSSIYHDFLLLDRPMVFIPYDSDDMEDQQGFLYDYFANLPGPAVQSFEEFVFEIKIALQGDDLYRENRDALRNKIHKYCDTESSRRVGDLVIRSLQEL